MGKVWLGRSFEAYRIYNQSTNKNDNSANKSISTVHLHWHGISISESNSGSCFPLKNGMFIGQLFLIVTCFIKINSTVLR